MGLPHVLYISCSACRREMQHVRRQKGQGGRGVGVQECFLTCCTSPAAHAGGCTTREKAEGARGKGCGSAGVFSHVLYISCSALQAPLELLELRLPQAQGLVPLLRARPLLGRRRHPRAPPWPGRPCTPRAATCSPPSSCPPAPPPSAAGEGTQEHQKVHRHHTKVQPKGCEKVRLIQSRLDTMDPTPG